MRRPKDAFLLGQFDPTEIQVFSHNLPVIGDIHILQRKGMIEVWVAQTKRGRAAMQVRILLSPFGGLALVAGAEPVGQSKQITGGTSGVSFQGLGHSRAAI